MGGGPTPTEFCEESVTVMKTDHLHESSYGDRPKVKPTITQMLWLNEITPKFIPYVKSRGADLNWQDAEDIVSDQRVLMLSHGFDGTYDNALLAFHLKRRISDFFRRLKAIKRCPSDACECGEGDCTCKPGRHPADASEGLFAAIPDEKATQSFRAVEARSDLEAIYARVWPFLNEVQKLLLKAARRDPAGGLNRTSLYDSMTEDERSLIARSYSGCAGDEESIKCAIASRTGELCRLIRRILDDDQDFPR